MRQIVAKYPYGAGFRPLIIAWSVPAGLRERPNPPKVRAPLMGLKLEARKKQLAALASLSAQTTKCLTYIVWAHQGSNPGPAD